MSKKLFASLSVVSVVLLLFFNACSNSGNVSKLTRKSAAKIIQNHPNRYTEARAFVTEGKTANMVLDAMPGVSNFFAANLVESRDLSRIGYIDLVCVTLTEKGKSLSSKWEKKEGEDSEASCPHDAFWTVPVADVERLEVTGIRMLSDTSSLVDYELEYKLNKTGKAFKEVGVNNPLPYAEDDSNLEEDIFKYTASLELYDDGWRIKDVEQTE